MICVIDTNVLLVANGQHKAVSHDCIKNCIEKLMAIKLHGKVLIDDDYEILKEYKNKTSPNTGNRVGDMFLKWLLQNKANKKYCEQVSLIKNDVKKWESFPDDTSLEDFDEEDKKFVAVSIVHPKKPKILQSADTRWLQWAPHLENNGVKVEFLCKKDILKFRKSGESV